MAEDLTNSLQTHTAQLQQVEAALTNDPENEELLKLKTDLQEVIELTQDLLDAKPSSSTDDSSITPSSNKLWNLGDECQAIYSDDGLYYDAVISEIVDDSRVQVTFNGWGNKEITSASSLKPVDSNKRSSSEAGLDGDQPKSKKELLLAQRDYKRKKNQKKAQRLKDLEVQREGDKSKWQQFNSKAFSKAKKGIVRKSIFATPESNTGRVGVGTCGTGGKPMTQFEQPKHVVVRK
ncbi:survival of motor neuron-related-splicing factor 30-like [Saccoglossus kowalevskii]|uniref:Survival of motor neuron-related-splicing factor 30 n=1 Tax=Saccoglossus kowalevskii TaxID=10224 RepID=A0ABM0GNE7_SACKO|nr:PREDICTED: survival of motor neuron-related-splicing factor 30-like [Saccoglossus kowalevskii]